jgi:D-tyrosyl-tRNA(Tyr) deacylase
MKVVIQRVNSAKVEVENLTIGSIQKGLLLFIGVGDQDEHADVDWLVNKIVNLRIFSDESGKMNHNLNDVQGACLCISQFTLHAKTKKGNRPSFIRAAKPDKAISLYDYFIAEMEKRIAVVEKGEFGADMDVTLVNDGPITIIIDTKDKS